MVITMFYYFDPLYFLFLLPGLIVAIWAQISVKNRFHKYSSLYSLRHITAEEAAKQVLSQKGVYNVRIERVSGNLSDHYDPKTNVIRLSDSVYGSTSIAAIGVAAHEAGHALQYAEGYFPIKLRSAMVPICNFGSGISPLLMVFGFIFNFPVLINLGILFFALAVLFQLVTLPVEFNASRRAIAAVSEGGILYEEEQKGAKKVLGAAAMTYVAAMLQSLLMLFYYITRYGRRNN